MGNRMRFLEEQADKDAVKIVIMCAKNTVQSRLESTNGSGFYSISDLPKHGKAAHKLQQICGLFTWHKKNWVSLKTVWFQPCKSLPFSYCRTKSESQNQCISLSDATTRVVITDVIHFKM